MIKILVIDGMGGGIGKAIIEKIKATLQNTEIIAVGTNAIATTAMLKGGADFCATGENAVVFNAGNADCIIGVVGIAFANSMFGEVSPAMANAVSRSRAHKILIPIDKCSVSVAGVTPASVQEYIADAVERARHLVDNSRIAG
ncbi:MAG: DUF3842 family protein [Defluviitaleaceae bacterium]|nr:DUF3842 family protein [Defluviitaleaceae bacterium]MCL2276186.1 DUF3842 family protein [Defluviitaleaceae bacterium]